MAALVVSIEFHFWEGFIHSTTSFFSLFCNSCNVRVDFDDVKLILLSFEVFNFGEIVDRCLPFAN